MVPRAYFASVMGALFMAAGCTAAPGQPTGLLCELTPEPLGVEDFIPAFSWIVNDPKPDAAQTARQIVVKTGCTGKQTVMWDSGKVASSQSIAVPYGGPALKPGQLYGWTVRTWNAADEVSPYAAPQVFVTALKETWSAKPVWGAAENAFVFLRGAVELPDKPIDKAFAFVSGRDADPSRQYVFRFYVNERPIGVGPARGYSGKIPYSVFDMTDALAAGKTNVLAAICFSNGQTKDFIAEVRVFYTDGTAGTFGTDGSWRAMNADTYYNMGRRFFQ